MRLKFALYPNPFRPHEYMATVQPNGIRDLDYLLEDMASVSRRYSAAELAGIFSLFTEAVAHQLRQGNHVHLPFLKITTSIGGKFTNPQDRFDAKRHRVNVNVNPGKQFTALAEQIQVQKVSPTRPTPWIISVRDLVQDTERALTPGSPAEIKGKHLKMDESHPKQGLFLTRSGQPDIRVTELYVNLSTRLLFKVPADVPEGSYHLMVRTTVGNSTELRQGYSDYPLLVAASVPSE